MLEHRPGYPSFSVGEARYCLKLNPAVFDYLTVDADRKRVMPSGYDWDHGSPLNVKEARRMTTGVHKGEPEHKYDYSAVLAETPAYGWSSTGQHVSLWLVNPSIEYLGGGPTKAELTGHLDVNPGGLPTLLNMWVGSHYGGTSLSIGTNENWLKVVGPFFLYCNSGPDPDAMWHDALAKAAKEEAAWPYRWMRETNYPLSEERGTVTGRLKLEDIRRAGFEDEQSLGRRHRAGLSRRSGVFVFRTSKSYGNAGVYRLAAGREILSVLDARRSARGLYCAQCAAR